VTGSAATCTQQHGACVLEQCSVGGACSIVCYGRLEGRGMREGAPLRGAAPYLLIGVALLALALVVSL